MMEQSVPWPHPYALHYMAGNQGNWSPQHLPNPNASDHNNHDALEVSLFRENFVLPLVFGLSLIVGLLGNGLVVLVVLWQCLRRSPDVINVYFLNLALADALYLVVGVPTVAITYLVPYWPFGEALCKAVHYLLVVAMATSVSTMTAIAIDRYQAVVRPQHAKAHRSVRRALVIMGCMWFFNALAAGPAFVKARHSPTAGLSRQYCVDEFEDRRLQRAYTFTMCLLYYCLPLLTLSYTYGAVLWRLSALTNPVNPIRPLRRRRKVLRIMVPVIVTFASCWLPAHALQILEAFHRPIMSHFHSVISIIAHTLPYLNSAMNPIIYSFASRSFQKCFRDCLRYCFVAGVRSQTEPSRRRRLLRCIQLSVLSTSAFTDGVSRAVPGHRYATKGAAVTSSELSVHQHGMRGTPV